MPHGTTNANPKSLRARRDQLLQPVQLFISDIFDRVRLPRRGRGDRKRKVVEDKDGQSAHLRHIDSGGGSSPCEAKNTPQQEDIRRISWSEISKVMPPSQDQGCSCDSDLWTPAVAPPALSLPNELLSDIFILCVPDFASAEELQDGLPALYPWDLHPHTVRRHLTQVCHRWRAIAISSPALWSTLVLGRTLKWDLENVKTWLIYSHSCPLDILIRPRNWSRSNTRVSTMLKLLRGEVGRIRCFMAQHLHWEELLELLPLHPDAVTQLPSMEIFCIRQYTARPLGPDAALPEPDMGRVYAPKLAYLELAETHLLTSFLTTSYLPIQHIILATSKYPVPSSTYLQFLACCPDLNSLHIYNDVPLLTNGPMWPDTRLTLPALSDLRFLADHTPDTMFFLRSLHVPKVYKLQFGQYNFSHHPVGFVLQVFWHLLTETASTLTSLTLDHTSLPIGDNLAGPLLRNVTNLKRLSIENVHLKPDVLECLIPEPGAPRERWPCPQLTFLTLRNVDIEGDALPRLILARALSNEERKRARENISKHGHTEGVPCEENKTDKVQKEEDNMDNNGGWDVASTSSTYSHECGPDDVDQRLRVVGIFQCNILTDETLAALVDVERTHSDVVHFRR